jgi:methionyl-tRNA formyltransferase
MRVVFAGTPEFAAVALRALLQAGHTVQLVLTQPDRPAGRGMQLQASSVKQVALEHGIEVLQPLSLRVDSKDPQRAQEAAEAQARLSTLDYDVMVVAAYGLILPRWTLDIRPCLNIHGSLLPRWRGAAPIHRAIEAGDAETGITIMQMEEGLDTGPMLSMERVPILDATTTGALHDELAALGGRMIVEALRTIAGNGGRIDATPQPEDGVTYAAKISKDEAKLDFGLPAATLARKVRAFDPFPGAQAQAGGTVVKIWSADPVDGQGEPGQVLVADAQHGIVVACGEGALRLATLQKPGGKRLAAAEFLKGFSFEGVQFGAG